MDPIPPPVPELTFSGSPPSGALLSALFSRGAKVLVPLGRPVRDVLSHGLGIAPDYIENRIQTVFVNARPVDDLDHLRLHEGDVVSLSAAMPGLVGATMRRAGTLAGFRGGITATAEGGEPAPATPGFITLKLFNFVAGEIGPLILRSGVLVNARELADLMSGPITAPGEGVHAVLDGVPVAGPDLGERIRRHPGKWHLVWTA